MHTTVARSTKTNKYHISDNRFLVKIYIILIIVLGLVLDITFYIVWKNIQYSKHFSIGIKFKLIQGIKVIYPVPVLIEVFIGNPKDSFTIIQSTFTNTYSML